VRVPVEGERAEVDERLRDRPVVDDQLVVDIETIAVAAVAGGGDEDVVGPGGGRHEVAREALGARVGRIVGHAARADVHARLHALDGRLALQLGVREILGEQARLTMLHGRRELRGVHHLGEAGDAAHVVHLDVVAGHAGHALERAHRGVRRGGGAAAPARHRGVGVRAHDQDRLHALAVDGQQAPLVLEKDHALAGPLEGRTVRLAVEARDREVGLRALEPAEAQRCAHDPLHLVVDRGHRDLARFEGGEQDLTVHVVAGRHLDVEPTVRGRHAVVHRQPVGHQDALEAPLLLEHAEVERTVLRHVLAVHLVVRVHHRPDVRLLDRRLERREIDLAHRALVDDGVGVVAVVLRVVAHEVLDGRGHALALDAVDVGHRGARREERVLAEVLEVPRDDGGTIDVDARREQEVHALGARLAPELHADALHELGIPGGGQRDAAAERRGGAVVAHAHGAVGHAEAGDAEPRNAPHVEVVHSADQVDLLFDRHLLDEGFGLRIDITGGCRRLCHGKRRGTQDENERRRPLGPAQEGPP
jgi:hypothetical protein